MEVYFLGKLGDMIARKIEIERPKHVRTANQFREWLGTQYPDAADDLASPRLKIVVDDEIVLPTASVSGAKTVEFFPLVSGG